MSKATRATRALAEAGIAFTVHTYAYDPDADRVGLQAAEALGESPQRVLKTLMALVDGKPVCVILPSDREVAMKKLAAACGGKHAEMMKKFPDMEHDDPNAKSVDPGKTSEIVWRFTKAGTFEFACLIPGHREAGMHGTVTVK